MKHSSNILCLSLCVYFFNAHAMEIDKPLTSQIKKLHADLSQLKSKLQALNDGLDDISKSLKGEKIEPKKRSSIVEPEEGKTIDSRYAVTLEDVFVEDVNKQLSGILTSIANEKDGIANLSNPDFTDQKPNDNAIDIERFKTVLQFREDIEKIIGPSEGALPKQVTSDVLEKIKSICNTFIDSIREKYDALNIFKKIAFETEDTTVVTEEEFKKFSEYIDNPKSFDPEKFKIFTRAKRNEPSGIFEKAEAVATQAIANRDFWAEYNRVPYKDTKFTQNHARAGGRIIDFLILSLSNKIAHAEDLGDFFGKLAAGFGLRTQAAASIYPFLLYGYKNPDFLKCAVQIVLGISGQITSDTKIYYPYKHLTNPSIHMLLEKISDGTYDNNDLDQIIAACEEYNASLQSKCKKDCAQNHNCGHNYLLTIPSYGKSISNEKEMRLRYTPQGIRTKMEILATIYARKLKDLMQAQQDPRLLQNKIMLLYGKKREEELQEKDKKIREKDSALRAEIRKIEGEIEAKYQEIDTKKRAAAEKASFDRKKKIEDSINKYEAAKTAALEKFNIGKEKLEEEKKNTLANIENIVRDKIIREEAEKIASNPTVNHDDDIYLNQLNEELKKFIHIFNDSAKRGYLFKYTKILKDFYGTQLFILNNHQKLLEGSRNKDLIPEILKKIDDLADKALRNKEHLLAMCLNSLNQGKTLLKEQLDGSFDIPYKTVSGKDGMSSTIPDVKELQDIEKFALVIGRLIALNKENPERKITNKDDVITKIGYTNAIKIMDEKGTTQIVIDNILPYYLLIRGGIYDATDGNTKKVIDWAKKEVADKLKMSQQAMAVFAALRYWESKGAVLNESEDAAVGIKQSREYFEQKKKAEEVLIKKWFEEQLKNIESKDKEELAEIQKKYDEEALSLKDDFAEDKTTIQEIDALFNEINRLKESREEAIAKKEPEINALIEDIKNCEKKWEDAAQDLKSKSIYDLEMILKKLNEGVYP